MASFAVVSACLLQFCAAVLYVAVHVRGVGGAAEHRIEWTTAGVQNYSGSSLLVELGDVVILMCAEGKYSNIVYQEDREQYEACDTGVSSGSHFKLAECNGEVRPVQIIIKHFPGLFVNNVNFEPGKDYYFTSYSNGTLFGAVQETTRGGECLDGLKMVISVAPEPSATTAVPKPTPGEPKGSEEGGGSSSNSLLQPPVIAGGVAGLVVLVFAFIVVIGCVLILKFGHFKKKRPLPQDEEKVDATELVTLMSSSVKVNGVQETAMRYDSSDIGVKKEVEATKAGKTDNKSAKKGNIKSAEKKDCECAKTPREKDSPPKLQHGKQTSQKPSSVGQPPHRNKPSNSTKQPPPSTAAKQPTSSHSSTKHPAPSIPSAKQSTSSTAAGNSESRPTSNSARKPTTPKKPSSLETGTSSSSSSNAKKPPLLPKASDSSSSSSKAAKKTTTPHTSSSSNKKPAVVAAASGGGGARQTVSSSTGSNSGSSEGNKGKRNPAPPLPRTKTSAIAPLQQLI